jgi:lipid-binding SYLF domain-containing protein
MRLFPTAVVLMSMACLIGLPSAALADAAAERTEIDGKVDTALAKLHESVPGSQQVEKQAYGVLVFPDVFRAGIGIGGEYGKGALRVQGKSVAYYSTGGASIGLQLGAETRSMVFMFMTTEALQNFQHSSGWDVGGDASVALVDVGASGAVDASRLGKPVLAFVFGNLGLMGSLSLEGTKVSKLDLTPDTASGSTAPK